MSGTDTQHSHDEHDEHIPEPGHGRMPRLLAMAWVLGLAFLFSSVAYAVWHY
jgi:hypothetical protein